MFGTYCWLGVPKIQKMQIITPPNKGTISREVHFIPKIYSQIVPLHPLFWPEYKNAIEQKSVQEVSRMFTSIYL